MSKVCFCVTYTKDLANLHSLSRYRRNWMESKKKKNCICSICDKVYASHQSLWNHKQKCMKVPTTLIKSNEEKIGEIEKERDSINENLSRYKQKVKTNGQRLKYVDLNMKELQLEVNDQFNILKEYVLHDSIHKEEEKEEGEEERDKLLKFIDVLQIEVQEKFIQLVGFIKSWNEVNHIDLLLERSNVNDI